MSEYGTGCRIITFGNGAEQNEPVYKPPGGAYKRISRQDWKTWYVVMDPFFLVPRLLQYLHRTTPVPLQKNVKHTTKESRAKMEQCKYFDFQPSKK